MHHDNAPHPIFTRPPANLTQSPGPYYTNTMATCLVADAAPPLAAALDGGVMLPRLPADAQPPLPPAPQHAPPGSLAAAAAAADGSGGGAPAAHAGVSLRGFHPKLAPCVPALSAFEGSAHFPVVATANPFAAEQGVSEGGREKGAGGAWGRVAAPAKSSGL